MFSRANFFCELFSRVHMSVPINPATFPQNRKAIFMPSAFPHPRRKSAAVCTHHALPASRAHSTAQVGPVWESSSEPARGGSSHGGEQQHHGVRHADGAHLRRARHRVGGVVRVGAGGGVRAAGALARGHPGRAHPAGGARGLRRRLLEPPPPPGLLPLRHGGAHRPPHRTPRLRLRRHPRLRGLPGARPRVRRVPPRRLLHVAARLRLRRPRPLGGDQVMPRRLGHLQEARPPGRIRQRRTVLPVPPHAAPVRLLQAAVGVRVRVREPDDVDEPGAARRGAGLRAVEQRPWAAVLRVRVMPRGPPGGAAEAVAQGQHRPRCRHRLPRLPLPHRLQRLQERPRRRHLPPLQVVILSNSPMYYVCFSIIIIIRKYSCSSSSVTT